MAHISTVLIAALESDISLLSGHYLFSNSTSYSLVMRRECTNHFATHVHYANAQVPHMYIYFCIHVYFLEPYCTTVPPSQIYFVIILLQ